MSQLLTQVSKLLTIVENKSEFRAATPNGSIRSVDAITAGVKRSSSANQLLTSLNSHAASPRPISQPINPEFLSGGESADDGENTLQTIQFS